MMIDDNDPNVMLYSIGSVVVVVAVAVAVAGFVRYHDDLFIRLRYETAIILSLFNTV
jgi:hypothetical protein